MVQERGCILPTTVFHLPFVRNWNENLNPWGIEIIFQLLTQKRGSANRISLDSPPCGVLKAGPLTMEMISIIKGIFKVVSCVGTYDILRRIKERGKCRYRELPDNMSIDSRNKRLIQMKSLKLITHHFERGKEKRIEWYEITDKGIKFLSLLGEIDELGDD